MVCERCVMSVRQMLNNLDIKYSNLQLGQAELEGEPAGEKMEQLRNALFESGFELLDDKKSAVVERIKNVIVSLVQGYGEEEINMKISAILEEKLQMDYHYLTTLFSSVEGITIEKYVILQRIEKVKELLMYDELNLSEIAWQLGYSSVQHLSQQFKKVTGLTPSAFKQLKDNRRKPLDKI